ncbi:MAG: hypothetical protein AAFY70_03440 [Bacteroidota bacterium]
MQKSKVTQLLTRRLFGPRVSRTGRVSRQPAARQVRTGVRPVAPEITKSNLVSGGGETMGGGLGQVIEMPGSFIGSGRPSVDRMTVALSITVPEMNNANDAPNAAFDAVLSAGNWEDDYTGRLITDAAVGTTFGSTEGVTITASYGNSSRGTVKNFQKLIRENGLAVVHTRVRFNAQLGDAQLAQNLFVTQLNLLGSDDTEPINLDNHYDPSYFEQGVIDITTPFIMGPDTLVEMRILPGQTVTFNFTVGAVQNMTHLLKNAVASRL